MASGLLGDKPLRIAFAGAGAISVFHLTGWQTIPNVQVVAICDPILDKARACAAEFDVPAVYAEFVSMLDQEQPDAVEIATPVGTHASLVRLAAERGVHVSCQKPLTPTVAEAAALIAALIVRGSGLTPRDGTTPAILTETSLPRAIPHSRWIVSKSAARTAHCSWISTVSLWWVAASRPCISI
jgi:hypothetical protein